MGNQSKQKNGDVFAAKYDGLLHRALDAEHRCDLIRESARHWKRRAMEAEKRLGELNDEISMSREIADSWKKTAINAEKRLKEKNEELVQANKALDDTQKRLAKARANLLSANEDYHAQELELMKVKAHAYDVITRGALV